MAANLIELWTVDYQKVAHMIQELEIAGSRRLDDLLVMASDIRTHGATASIESPFNECRVDELLDGGVSPRQLLSEIDALDASAQRWRTALGGFREAVEAQSRADTSRAEKPALCEADDEYWYL